MAIIFTVYFSEYGVPKTGLTPSIYIKAVSDGSTVVNAQAMAETGFGWYKYSYAGALNSEDYVGYADGGAGQPTGERYAPVSSGVVGSVQAIQTLVAAIDITDGKVNVGKINDVSVDGVGSESDPWGPA